MRRTLLVTLSIGLLTASSAGCAAVGDRVDELRGATGELRDDLADGGDGAGFCLSLTRTATAIASGSPDTAEEAAEEALARAPDELVDDTREVAEVVRRVRDDDAWDPTDPELTEAVDQLTETARRACEPG